MSNLEVTHEKSIKEIESTGECSKSSNNIYGPILPAHLLTKPKEKSTVLFGPALPRNLQELSKFRNAVPTDILDDSTEDIIGPLPITNSLIMTQTQLELEERAIKFKLESLKSEFSEKDEITREDWMVELPEVMSSKNVYPTNRKFRIREGPDFNDRSCWTEIQGDKKSDISKQKSNLQKMQKKETKIEQGQLSHREIKKRMPEKSLVEIHREKLKAKKEKESKILERRPFSREVDLQNNRPSSSHTNSLIKKAQLLEGKFTSGQGKFL